MKTCTICGSTNQKQIHYAGPTCSNCYRSEQRRLNPNKFLQKDREYKKSLPKETKSERALRYQLKYHYGLSTEQFSELILKQDNACAICRTSFEARPSIAVDHCHTKGSVRGLLCRGCNTGIGMLREKPENFISAFNYLEDHNVGIK